MDTFLKVSSPTLPNFNPTHVCFSSQSWKDQLQKAKDLYEQAKSATRRQTLLTRNSSRSYCSGELVMDVEYRHQQYVASRMVSRGSRMSSVTGGGGHSHSGSMDISGDSPQSGTPNVTSNSIRRNRSFEFRQQQLQQQEQQQQQEGHRASSFSSDDGNGQPQQQPTNAASTPTPLSPLKQQQSLPAQGSSYPASPRVERRLTTPSSSAAARVTPNTLTVQIGGDSSSASATESASTAAAASIPTSSSFPCNNSSCGSSRSPADSPSWQSRSRSPGPRGITYPPPSPKSLKRGVAIQSSLSLKNPPLLKSRPVQQTIPMITGESNTK